MKRRTLFNLALALGCAPASVLAAGSRQLRVVTAHLPPLVLENGGDRPGALYELLMELCKRMKLEPKVEFFPWEARPVPGDGHDGHRHFSAYPLAGTGEQNSAGWHRCMRNIICSSRHATENSISSIRN
jgi:hypothetical protein